MIILILKICLLSWFVVEMPLFSIPSALFIEFFKIKNEVIKFIIEKPFMCYKCSAFWVGLILTGGNIWIALLCSFIMKLYDQKLNVLEI